MKFKTYVFFPTLVGIAISFWLYNLLSSPQSRLNLIISAFKKLYIIKDEEVSRFLQSYKLFTHEQVNKENQQFVLDYYNVLNYLCALGEAEKMYIPPVIDPKLGVFDNQIEYEKRIINFIGAEPGKKILDVGCGRGGVASHIASISGAHVTGINIDPTQLETARERAKKLKITDKTNFIEHSFNNPLPFENETFDGLYNIQALTYAQDYESLFKELFRVLKPGAKLSFLEWIIYDYDENNSTHRDLMMKCKALIGAVYNPTAQEYVDALEKAGFVVEVNENSSIDGLQYTLIEAADYYFTTLQAIVNFFVKIGVFPQTFGTLMDRLTQDAQAFIEGDKLRLWTTCHQFVAVKPNK